jgi:hypothetical protein
MMVLTTGRIKRHRYSFTMLTAIRRASSRGRALSLAISTLMGR